MKKTIFFTHNKNDFNLFFDKKALNLLDKNIKIIRNQTNRHLNDKEILKIDVGLYNPLLGKSYNEMSSESRSMHKSQGFGSLKRRGNENELFILTQGEGIESDIMDGIDISWKRVNANKSTIVYFTAA